MSEAALKCWPVGGVISRTREARIGLAVALYMLHEMRLFEMPAALC